jgi:hypothetical protein
MKKGLAACLTRDRRWSLTMLALIVLLSLSLVQLTSHWRRERALTHVLQGTSDELERLVGRDSSVTIENIRAAGAEAARLAGFATGLERHFAPPPEIAHLDSRTFRAQLETTIARLRADASAARVVLPSQYWFAFAAQKGTIDFDTNTLPTLALQLDEIAALCQVLFDSRVNALEWVKRVPNVPGETLDSLDYLDAKATTNSSGVLMPYQLAFEGYSAQLAAVLARLTKSSHFFIVRNIAVEPVPSTPVAIPDVPRAWPYHRPLGLPPQRRETRSRPSTYLSENLLRFTLSVDAVRFEPGGAARMAANGRRY